MNAETIRAYAADPLNFLNDLQYPAGKFADIKAPFQTERAEALAPSLLAVARGEKPPITRFWTTATKGASKDTDYSAAILWLALFSPRMLTIQVGAADRDQANELRKAAKTLLNLNPWIAEGGIEIQQWAIINKRTETSCDIIAADTAGSHGARPDVLILNELTHIQKREFAENLMDNATKVPGGIVIIATNAGHLDTWAHEWMFLAKESPRWFFHEMNEPAPWLSEAEIAEAQVRNPPTRFARLFRGQWVSHLGDALPQDLIDKSVVLHGPCLTPVAEHVYVAGCDLALRRDSASVVVLGVDPVANRIRVVDVEVWTPQSSGGQIDLLEIQSHIRQQHARFNFFAVWCDSYQSEQMSQSLQAVGVPFIVHHSTLQQNDEMARGILRAFQDQLLALFPHETLLSDIRKLRLVERPNNRLKLTAERDEAGHSDSAFAMAACLPEALNVLDEMRREPIETTDNRPEVVFT